MARTLTSAAQTERDKNTGAFIRRILEIQWGGATGTKYYSTEVLSSPVTAEGRVLDWGELQLEGDPERVGGHGQVRVQLADHDHVLRGLMEAKPGPQNKQVYLWLYYEGTTWASDRVKLFGGVIAAPAEWSDATATWDLTLKGLELHFDRTVGLPVTRQAFPEVICESCESEIIPIVYGDPCRRVPACVIERPGAAQLNSTLNIHDNKLYIHRNAGDANFTTGSTITLVVGVPGNTEEITGSFASADTNVFNISSRYAIQASGDSPGVYGDGGQQFFLISQSDVTSPATSRGGYPMWIYHDSAWNMYMVDRWSLTGSNIITVQEPVGVSFLTGMDWKLGRYAGVIPIFPTGTPVYEKDDWTYAVNWLPSKEIQRVEARGKAQTSAGQESQTVFFTYNTAYYSVNLNNKSYNDVLNREEDDPGITTITVNAPPTSFGFGEEGVWVTLRGITDDETEDGTPLTNAADIIEHLLTSDFLGNINSAFIDSASFAAAQAAITTVCAFAITDERKLLDLCSELAFQNTCLYYWDQGTAVLRKLDNTLDSSDNQLTVTPSRYARQSLRIKSIDLTDLVTEVLGRFRLTGATPESKILRTSDEATGYFGANRKELDFWAFQAGTSVALASEFWLTYWLQRNRLVEFDLFLHGLHLQPGDTVLLDIDDGNGNTIFDSVLARVRSLKNTALNVVTQQMETITVEAEVNLWSWTIEATDASDDECYAAVPEPDPFDPGENDLPPNEDPDPPDEGSEIVTSDIAPSGPDQSTPGGSGSNSSSSTSASSSIEDYSSSSSSGSSSASSSAASSSGSSSAESSDSSSGGSSGDSSASSSSAGSSDASSSGSSASSSDASSSADSSASSSDASSSASDSSSAGSSAASSEASSAASSSDSSDPIDVGPCTDMPSTLYLVRQSDDGLIATLSWDGSSKWVSGVWEFYYTPAPGEWKLDEDGTEFNSGVFNCTGTLGVFSGTSEGIVRVQDTAP